MKELRKFLIILASIMVAISGSLPVVATTGFVNEEVDENITMDKLSLANNEVDAVLKINTIKYNESDSKGTGTVVAPTDDEWYIKTIVVAYMNFEQGVTEEEADQNLSDLTDAKNDAWVVLSKYRNLTSYAGKVKNISMNQSGNSINIYTNKSDILYYAVEFGKITEDKQWDEVWWSRGKIDYRSCVHSSVFDEATMTCKRLEDNNMAYYVPQVGNQGELVLPPENDKVLSWEDEWKDVIKNGYEKIQNELDLMSDYANYGVTILDKNDLALDGLLKGAMYFRSDSDMIGLPQSIVARKNIITELRKFYDRTESSDGSDESEIEIIVKENERLKIEKEELESKNEELEQEKGALETENADLKQSNDVLKSEKEMLEQEILRLKAEKAAFELMNGNLEKENDALHMENDALKGENTEMRAENVMLAGENMDVKAERDNLRLEKDRANELNAELVEQLKETQDMIQKLQAAEKETENIPEVNVAIGTEEVINSQNTTEIDEKLAEKKEENRDFSVTQEVEVPTLGEGEVRTNGLWWILIPLVGLAGAIILALKRKFLRG